MRLQDSLDSNGTDLGTWKIRSDATAGAGQDRGQPWVAVQEGRTWAGGQGWINK